MESGKFAVYLSNAIMFLWVKRPVKGDVEVINSCKWILVEPYKIFRVHVLVVTNNWLVVRQWSVYPCCSLVIDIHFRHHVWLPSHQMVFLHLVHLRSHLGSDKDLLVKTTTSFILPSCLYKITLIMGTEQVGSASITKTPISTDEILSKILIPPNPVSQGRSEGD